MTVGTPFSNLLDKTVAPIDSSLPRQATVSTVKIMDNVFFFLNYKYMQLIEVLYLDN